ncbi:MAG: hypothetical protein ABI999_12055 [Acidobacteriota bacterium]
MFWKIVLILGILGVLLGLVVALPVLTNGRTGWDEALIGIIPGSLVLIISFFMAVIGAIFVIKNRSKK